MQRVMSQKNLGGVLLIFFTHNIKIFVQDSRIHGLISHKRREKSNVVFLKRTGPIYFLVTFLVEIPFCVLGDMTLRNTASPKEICRLLVLGK